MLWPIRWTGWSPKACSICSPSRWARRSTPASGGTRVTSTRFPAVCIAWGIPRKYVANVTGPTPIREKPPSPWASTIGESSRANDT